jgi:Icc-related predicted phosphoesterase
MKLTFLSDTHMKHDQLTLGSGNILFHCGDFTHKGALEHVENFARYMKKQNFTYKVVIAGNHDFCFENELKNQAENILRKNGIIYLNDSGVQLLGLNIWGSPVQPWFHDWAFNRQRGKEIRQHWQLIPENTDILLTHGPPYDILDFTHKSVHSGCKDLLKRVKIVKPRIHAFGHIHEAYGVVRTQETTYLNSSVVDVRNRCVNDPISMSL